MKPEQRRCKYAFNNECFLEKSESSRKQQPIEKMQRESGPGSLEYSVLGEIQEKRKWKTCLEKVGRKIVDTFS